MKNFDKYYKEIGEGTFDDYYNNYSDDDLPTEDKLYIEDEENEKAFEEMFQMSQLNRQKKVKFELQTLLSISEEGLEKKPNKKEYYKGAIDVLKKTIQQIDFIFGEDDV